MKGRKRLRVHAVGRGASGKSNSDVLMWLTSHLFNRKVLDCCFRNAV
jgi:hypothetical protein